MKREDFETEDEYLEYRRKANERNKKYYSKPEVKIRKAVYKKKYEQLPHVKEAEKKMRDTPHYKSRMKKWREDNDECIKKYRFTKKYKISKKKSNKKYYIKKRKIPSFIEDEKQRQKEFRKKQPEKVRAHKKKYLKSDKGNMNYRYHNQRRIAVLKNVESELTAENTQKIFDRDKCCVYCGSSRRLEIDHIVPISNGGNSLMNNLVIACKKCNCSKNGRDVFYWCKLMNKPVPSIVKKLILQQD